MNNLTNYNDLLVDIIHSLKNLTKIAVNKNVSPENIIWDPGIGFSKTTEQNIYILKKLDLLKTFDFPIL